MYIYTEIYIYIFLYILMYTIIELVFKSHKVTFCLLTSWVRILPESLEEVQTFNNRAVVSVVHNATTGRYFETE
jgi:hypothetical protein